MIPQETVNRILDAAQIVDVVRDFVTLKKAGADYKACCPFHNEKTPSFSVSPSKGIYKCFGCGKSGTAVGFVMEHENMTYVEALRYLAKKYNIEIVEKEESAEEIANRQRHESLLLVSEFAGKFYQDSLQTPDGQVIAYQYFRSRGLTDETIQKYGLGWAPVSRTDFSQAARAAGYKEEFLIDAGLSIKYDDGRLVDRFHDRVMFPIHSHIGRVIAFGGPVFYNCTAHSSSIGECVLLCQRAVVCTSAIEIVVGIVGIRATGMGICSRLCHSIDTSTGKTALANIKWSYNNLNLL